MIKLQRIATLTALWLQPIAAASWSLKPSYQTPVLASGWTVKLVAQNLESPRGIIFDSKGGLLLVQQGNGIIHLQLDDGGGTCLDAAKTTYLVNSNDLNHGIALSQDSKTLYASSSEAVFSWTYDAEAISVSSENRTLVTGMTNDDHMTRTLLLSQKQSGTLIVSRGSNSNIDPEAEDLGSGHSQIKAFDISNVSSSDPYDFNTQGRLLGWGLRNSVGVAEHPSTGGIFSVENSVDEITRLGNDAHEDNPGEELNYHGTLSSSTGEDNGNQGGNYRYPNCFAVWNVEDLNDRGDLSVGSQFTKDPNGTLNDTTCKQERVSPSLTFQAHMAPLDIVFEGDGAGLFLVFMGVGSSLFFSFLPYPCIFLYILDFNSSRQPTAAADNKTALNDIMWNADNSDCSDKCFRPVGLELDEKGRVFMSSDATGEVWVLERSGGSGDGGGKKNGGLRIGGEVWRGFWIGVWLGWWVVGGGGLGVVMRCKFRESSVACIYLPWVI